MTIAIRLPALRRAPRYERRPRVMADRRARAVMSRDRRWKQRSGSGMIGKVLAVLATIAIAGALWVAFKPETTPSAPPLAFPQFVAEVETAFPEALSGYTRAHGGQLLDGRDVPVSVRLLLPSNALRSAGAAPDALTRLSAPFVGWRPSPCPPGYRVAICTVPVCRRASPPPTIASCV